jgi:2-amino-4-hydroxy-6-hydroxymethyldihydropteridine diphosphokinase
MTLPCIALEPAAAALRCWQPAYIGIGSNLDDPIRQVRQALDGLAELAACRVVAVSALYSNPPMGPQDQPDYVNAAAGLLTQLSAQELLGSMQELERSLGRERKAGDRWGPRVIDLDLLVFGTAQIVEENLTLPHPGISERNFVLFPLCDIAPTLKVPGQGEVELLAQQLGDTGLQRLT